MSAALEITKIEEIARETAKRLSAAVGEPWDFDPRYMDHCWVRVIRSARGHGIHFARSQRGGRRLVISGDYPATPTNYSYHLEKLGLVDPTVGVSGDRPFEQIYAEIQRRLIPDYFKVWNFIKEKVEEEKRDKNTHRQTVEELAALAGAQVYDPHGSGEPYVHLSTLDDGEGFYGDVKVNYNGTSAKIELQSVPLDIVKRILAVLPQKKEKEA